MLNVCGGIKASKVNLLPTSGWCDYVFHENYKLTPLSELREFINQNDRLPEMPSETEILKSGIDVSEIITLHMKKIEELTLYILELEMRINELEK